MSGAAGRKKKGGQVTEIDTQGGTWRITQTGRIEPVAKLPWIKAKQTDSQKKLEDTKYFKDLMEMGDKKAGQVSLLLYKIANECFPYYLPKRFHTMDVRALYKYNANSSLMTASHFVLTNLGHSSRMYFDLAQADEKNCPPSKYQKLLNYFEGLRRVLEPNFEKCKDPKEFLLEPWVLVQLPFHPDILHQWLVGVLAEYLKFREQMAFLGLLSIPEEMKGVCNELLALGLSMVDHVARFIHLLEGFTYARHMDHPAGFNASIDLFLQPSFREILCVLEFLLSGKCSEIIKALKRMAWSEKTLKRCKPWIGSADSPVRGDMTFLYSYKFWTRRRFGDLFGGGVSYLKEKGCKKEHLKKYKESNAKLPFEDPNFYEPVTPEVLAKFIDEKIIKPGWLKGISREEMHSLIEENHSHMTRLMNNYCNYKWFAETSRGIREEDTGVITNLMNLHSEAQATEYLAKMISVLHIIMNEGASDEARFDGMVAYVYDNKVYFNAVDCDGPEFSMSEIKKIVSGVKTSKNWSMEGILAEIKKQCPPPKTKLLPDIEDGLLEILELFEARIKHIAFTLYESQFGKVKGKERRKVYLEIQIVQYMLPSMVASLLKLMGDSVKKDNVDNQWRNFAQRGPWVTPFWVSVGPPKFRNSSGFGPKASCGPVFRHTLHTAVYATVDNCYYFINFLHNLISEYEVERCFYVTAEAAEDFHSHLNHHFPGPFGQSLEWKGIRMLELRDQLFITSQPHNQWVWDTVRFVFSHFIDELSIFKEDTEWQLNFRNWTVHAHRFYSKVCHAMEVTLERFMCPVEPDNGMVVYAKENALIAFIHLLDLHVQVRQPKVKALLEEIKEQSMVWADTRNSGACMEDTLRRLLDLQLKQLAAVWLYLDLQNVNPEEKAKTKKKLAPIIPLDSLDVAFSAYLSDDWWKLRQVEAHWMHVKGFGDPSVVSLKFARTKMSLYGPVLDTLGPGMRVRMSQPGQSTCFPIKHCRWCGLVDCPEFRVCQMCQESEEYFDKNLFCSEKCESEAVEDVHREEHCRFVGEKCKY